jgi:hypothetical protein
MGYLYAHQTPKTVEDYFIPADIHEAARVEQDDQGLVFVLSVVWTLLHGINTYLTLWGHMPFWVGVLAHMVLGLILVMFSLARLRVGGETRFTLTLTITSCIAGVFGAFGTLLTVLLVFYYSVRAKNFIDWYKSIFPALITSRPEAIYEALQSGREEDVKHYSVIPFMDVIQLGTERQKRQAISRITEQFNPLFAPVLAHALKDRSNSIRVQTATAIAKIENSFSEMVMKIEKLERERPKDPIVKKGLARYYDDYAFTGILDPDRENLNRKKALQKYREYLDMAPNDMECRIRIGRLLLRSGESAEAADWFARSFDAGHRDRQLMLWYAQALFESGQFDGLRRLAKECMPMIDEVRAFQPQLALAIESWAQPQHMTGEAAR